MKSIKALIAALALGVVVSAPFANAQQKKGGAPTPEQQIERIEQAVGSLTAAQKTKITAIYEKGREEMKGVPKEERKDKMGEMMKKQRQEVRAVLTPEQQAKFDAMPQGGKKKN
jgi:Spy/CpxP family protein refolding chaperone